MENENNLMLDLFQAYYDARKNKRNTINQLQFEINYESNLFALHDQIVNRNYEIAPSICFMVDKPVKREIFAADFRDRVIHHLIYNYLSPFFEEVFIADSYSCRKEKGTHYGIRRLQHFIKECSHDYTRDCYIMKLDIQGYFMNINRGIMSSILEKFILQLDGNKINFDRDMVLYLVACVLDDNPIHRCKIRGSKKDWVGLPASKSLFSTPEDCGLPIGNLTSQLFSNVYLHELDIYVKKVLGVEYYGRYVDDFVMIHPDPEYLKNVKKILDDFLWENLKLKIHPNKIYLQHFSKGVKFLGAVVKPHRVYITNRTKANFIQCINKWDKFLQNEVPAKKDLENMQTAINSYLGLMCHYRTYNIRKKVMLNEKRPLQIYKYGYLQIKPYGKMKYCLFPQKKKLKKIELAD
ncbi:hypothetical protein D0T49_04885 [Paludibacter sp. 221]|uniref:reverse transcriptase/maturase family protein n=1 Tax=Paludibacter sp. 221 TaxID=2302939 RepID=UPI0013D1C879|nr:reverse transcriptase/maturase family protein [Paludibacter sp. 221]NDV46374.1 hypothetical protein [Paludibacter sp. 221]